MNMNGGGIRAFNCVCLFSLLALTQYWLVCGESSATSVGSEDVKKETTKPAVSLESDEDDYGDYSDEGGQPRQSRQRSVFTIKRKGVSYAWGKWDKWSKCSKSCVQLKRRQCVRRIQNDTLADATETVFYPTLNMQPHTGCFGIMKRYRLCKDDKCRTLSKQLRDEQCSDYDNEPYKGKFYRWVGYEKEHNECELYCRPRDSEIFISMNQAVTDGTPCEKPAVYYTHAYRRKAVCVEGICRAVHSSGAIRPSTTNDSQFKCGSVLCQLVSELFSKAKLSYGYNHVATIPAGAMNLTIKQISKSDNLLALKTTDDIFIISGNKPVSDSGYFEYNGDTYDYSREVGSISSKGPINKAVIVLLYARGLNTGVKYEYTIPVASDTITEDEELQTQWNELGQPLDEIDDNNIEGQVNRLKDRRRRKFSWKLLGFGECNRSCGPGVQPPIFRCIRDSPTRYYSPKRCAFAEKPVFSEDIYHCNRGLCPAYWRAGDYGECHCEEGAEEGLRTRYVRCVQEQITGKLDEVPETLCAEQKLPELNETCNCPKLLRRRIYVRDSVRPPKVYARLISAPPSVSPMHNSTQTLKRLSRNDRVGVWLTSGWNRECSSDCGPGVEYRTIYCDRTPPYTDLCDLRFTPVQKRICRSAESSEGCQRGVWFTTEWSNCTGDCFSLQRTRTVICLRDNLVVDDEECRATPKPSNVSSCTHKDVDFCGPTWHYSEWSECSRSCGEGIQRRYAKCLEFDWKLSALVESSNCKYLDREPVYGTCNTQKCEVFHRSAFELAPEQPASSASEGEACSDEFSNCQRINRQRLCKLQYYQTYCCQTCHGYF